MEGKPIRIDKLFSKGFIDDKGYNQIPDYFADDVWNIRIKNMGISPRDGHETIYYDAALGVPQFIKYNNGELLTCVGGLLYKVNYTLNPATVTAIGSTIGVTTLCNTISYGKYLIILTGAGFPWVYNGSTLIQLTATEIASLTNPQFGAKFAGFTVVNSIADPNSIRISAPIGIATQTNSYNWTTTGSASITYDSKVLGLVGTLNFLYIFTENTIEYIGKDNISNTGAISSLYSLPLGTGYQIQNSKCIVTAGDVVFFLTTNKKIGTIKYSTNIATPGIDIISDNSINSIDSWIEDMDISSSLMVFDKKNNLVKIYMKSPNSIINDICLIYDLNNQTWLKDNNKYVSDTTYIFDEIYTISPLSFTINKDESGINDNNDGVGMYFESANMNQGDVTSVKQYRGITISGQINDKAIINVKILIDNVKVYESNIMGTKYLTINDIGIAGSPIGGDPTGSDMLDDWWMSDFEYVISASKLRSTGKKIKVILSAEEAGQNIIIDDMSIYAKARRRKRIQDKI